MNFKKVFFIKDTNLLYNHAKKKLPHIAFLGRSNVGKSTLINIITNKNNLAITSKTPGKTKFINFFLIDNKFFFVDLPGYGYAKISLQKKKEINFLIKKYCKSKSNIKLVILVIDIRRGISNSDRKYINLLEVLGILFFIVISKCDKLTKLELIKQKLIISKSFSKINYQNLIFFSSKTKEGKKLILKQIKKMIY